MPSKQETSADLTFDEITQDGRDILLAYHNYFMMGIRSFIQIQDQIKMTLFCSDKTYVFFLKKTKQKTKKKLTLNHASDHFAKPN